MKAKAIIQARLGSTRLPGKVMMKINNKTILEYVVERVAMARRIEEVIVATTTSKDDLKIAHLISGLNVSVYCGSEDDVLDRYYQAARLFKAEHVVRVTSDCPLVDPAIIDDVLDRYFQSGADYCSNTLDETFPDGQDNEAFSFKALTEAWKNAKLISEREHVTPYIRNHPEKFKLVSVRHKEDLSAKRWTLDEEKDIGLIKGALEALYPRDPGFTMQDVLDFLVKNPELEEFNKGIIRNEGLLKSLEQDKACKQEG